MKSQLIFLEGLPGSGKTTTSTKIYEFLRSRNVNTNVYLEAHLPNPVNLAGYAYLTYAQYEWLCKKYKDEKFDNAILGEGYVLIPYALSKTMFYQGELLEFLRANEFCYIANPNVSFEIFSKVMLERWKKLNDTTANGEVKIFDGDFFQHPIEDIMRNFTRDPERIIRYFSSVHRAIKNLNPILFYITQRNEEESLARIADERNRDIFRNPSMIKHWKERKGIELEAIRQLPIRTYILDNSDYNWDKLFETIIQVLNKDLQERDSEESEIEY